MTICNNCVNKLWPTTNATPGQNIKCKKGFVKNMKENGYSSDWVFQQTKCDFVKLLKI